MWQYMSTKECEMTVFYLFTATGGEDSLTTLYFSNILKILKKCMTSPSWAWEKTSYDGCDIDMATYRLRQITVPTCAFPHVKECMAILASEIQENTYWQIFTELPGVIVPFEKDAKISQEPCCLNSP